MKLHFLILASFFAGVTCLLAAETTPEWVTTESARTISTYEAQVPSVTLLDESQAVLDPNGNIHRTLRYAIRILDVEGRADAEAAVPYFKRAAKVKELRAWLISPAGVVKAYGKESVMDINPQQDFTLYDETRVRLIRARNPEPGSTFAWTATVEETPLLFQDEWHFQGDRPVILSRYTITLPPAWKVQAETFNAPAIQPTVNGTTYTWEARNLPNIKHESYSPSLSSIAPWMGVSFYPEGQSMPDKVVKNWKELALWNCNLSDGQADNSPEMAAKVNELTSGAATPFDKMKAIAKYVQQIRYVEIATDLAKGGGYQPHLASDVFIRQYGDCKDKANLMRAMLKIAHIDSYLLAIFAGDRNYVHPEWAAPQFNHMILAIKTPAGVDFPALMRHPVLGPLLIFDATDTSVPIGELPEEEQGSLALLMAGQNGELVKMPSSGVETNRTDVHVEATLAGNGALQAHVHLLCKGDSASNFRGIYSYTDANKLQREMETWVAQTAKQNTLSLVEPKDDFDADQFGLTLAFDAPAYSQLVQRRMLIFRPGVISRLGEFQVQADKRTLPVVLPPRCYHKQVHVKLPAGFQVDEMPDAASFSTAVGTFKSTYKVDGNDLVFTEDLDVPASTIPAQQYPDVKQFFMQVAGAEQAPVLLVKN